MHMHWGLNLEPQSDNFWVKGESETLLHSHPHSRTDAIQYNKVKTRRTIQEFLPNNNYEGKKHKKTPTKFSV